MNLYRAWSSMRRLAASYLAKVLGAVAVSIFTGAVLLMFHVFDFQPDQLLA